MKATGIVRRIEECVIITPKPERQHKHWAFRWFAPPNALVSKTEFSAVFIHSKSEVKNTSPFYPNNVFSYICLVFILTKGKCLFITLSNS